MANALYGLAREAFLTGDIDWAADDIKCALIDTTIYTVTIDTDQYLDDISGLPGAIIATSANLGGKTTTLGVADATDTAFAVVAGAAGQAVVIYQDTGNAATSRLIAYIDTVASGLPTPAGTVSITVTWDAGANKIFRL